MMLRPLVTRFGLLLIGICLAVGCARRLPPAERVQTRNVNDLRVAFGSGSTQAAGPAVAAAEPTGWATIKGSFKLNGSPPDRPPLTIDKDQAICAPGGRPVLSETLVVDSATQGIKDVVIYLAMPGKFPSGDPKWEHSSYSEKRESTLDFDQKNCVFLTHMTAMRSTQKLRILNSDPVGHNTKIEATGKAAQLNATIPTGATVMYDPGGESQEPFNVACSIHPWMSARMISRDSPYFAVTKPDGTFEIANVPAGVPLEFRVWQERAKFLQGDMKVNGTAEKWSKGRVKLTLQPDEQKTLDVIVDVAVFK